MPTFCSAIAVTVPAMPQPAINAFMSIPFVWGE
jgi:hypothetical protein